LPLFTTNIFTIEGDEILTDAGRWWLSDDVRIRDDSTNEVLTRQDLQRGDFVRYVIQHTDVGDFAAEIVRNPQLDFQPDLAWEGNFEVFAVDGESREVFFAGPPVALSSRTLVFDRDGNEIVIDEIPLGVEIVVNQSPSLTGGPPVARSIEIVNPDKFYDSPTIFFTNFGGVEGDLILTVEHARYLAIDAEMAHGSGESATVDDLFRGARVRALINHAPPGLFTPFFDTIVRLVIDPQDEGLGSFPVETGDLNGFVIDVDIEGRLLQLDGPALSFDRFTEVVGVDFESLLIEDLAEGDLLAVNFFPTFEFLQATKIVIVDPLRAPTPRPDLIVAPLEGLDFEAGLIFLSGPVFSVLENAEIFSAAGSLIGLEDLFPGDEIRLSSRDINGVPTAERIKVSGDFEGPIFGGGGLEITSTFPAPGEVAVPTDTRVEVTFNEQVGGLFDDQDFDFGLFPDPLAFGGLEISRDGRTLLADVELEEDAVYQLFVASQRFGFFQVSFTTGDQFPDGAISGQLILPPEVPSELIAPEESGVILLDAQALLEEDTDVIVQFVSFGPSGEYRFDNVPDGDYVVYAEVVVEFGFNEQITLEAFFLDPQGELAVVSIDGDVVDEIDLQILPPDPIAIEEIAPDYGDTEVALSSLLAITFSAPLGYDHEGYPLVDGLIAPQPLSGPFQRDQLLVSEDGLTVSLDVEWDANTTYSVVVRNAESEDGLLLENPEVVVFTTGVELPEGVIEGNLALPERLPPEKVIRTPASLALIPFVDFDPFDPAVEQFAVAATLSEDGFYAFDHVEPGRYVVVAGVDVALPSFFRLPTGTLGRDFNAFEAVGFFGTEAPPDFIDTRFFGFSQNALGDVREDVEPDIEGIDFLLRPEDVRKVGLRITAVNPAPEELLNAPQVIDLSVEFSEELVAFRDFVEVDAFIHPVPLSGEIMDDFSLSEDGRRIFFTGIELETATSYRFTVAFARGVSGQELVEPFQLAIRPPGAADLVLGSVSGNVALEGDEISAAAVFLFEPNQAGLEVVAGALVEEDGTYLVEEVLAGTYAAFVELETVGGQNLLFFYDPDGDGLPDSFEVGGDSLDGIDFALGVETEGSDAGSGEGGPNATAALSLDLDTAAGDQMTTKAELAAGETIELAVYARDLIDVTGLSLIVGFDSTQVAFSSSSEGGADEAHIFRSAPGAVALFLPERLRGNSVEFGGAVLSPTEATVAAGDGLIGVVRLLL